MTSEIICKLVEMEIRMTLEDMEKYNQNERTFIVDDTVNKIRIEGKVKKGFNSLI